jgi:hypothetical protein
MFRKLSLIVICAAVLAACGGNNNNNASTATPAPAAQQSVPTAVLPGLTPSGVAPTNGPREYTEGTEEVQLPAPGTIVPPATQDPEAGKLFDTVSMNRMGGITGKELNVVLNSDGSLTRDGAASTVTPDQVKQISDKLDQMGIFGMQGVFQAPGTSADIYTYHLTVERSGSSKTIVAQDGYIPPQLADVLDLMTRLGTTP